MKQCYLAQLCGDVDAMCSYCVVVCYKVSECVLLLFLSHDYTDHCAFHSFMLTFPQRLAVLFCLCM